MGEKEACVYLGYGQENAGKNFTLAAFPPVLPESADTDEAEEVSLEAENAVFKEIDEAKQVASNTEGEAAEE